LVKEVSSLRRGLENIIGSGLLIKTLDDLEKERKEFVERYATKNKKQ
jgi:hypothetical protein